MESGMELRTLEDESSTDRRPVQKRLPAKLSPQEVAIFKRCEATIQKAVWGFAEAGQALNTIRSQRLYRAQHGTFRAYCRSRWGFEASRARQLIGAASVAQDLEGSVVKPSNEGQVRPLVALDTAMRREVWKKVAEKTTQPTERDVRQVIAEVMPPEAEAVAQQARDLITLLEYMVDAMQHTINLVQRWNTAMLEAEQKQELKRAILKTRDSMKDVQGQLI